MCVCAPQQSARLAGAALDDHEAALAHSGGGLREGVRRARIRAVERRLLLLLRLGRAWGSVRPRRLVRRRGRAAERRRQQPASRLVLRRRLNLVLLLLLLLAASHRGTGAGGSAGARVEGSSSRVLHSQSEPGENTNRDITDSHDGDGRRRRDTAAACVASRASAARDCSAVDARRTRIGSGKNLQRTS